MLGYEHGDNQLINTALICMIDIFVEMFDIVPNWRRRQLLLLDEILNIIYPQEELWHEEVLEKSFKSKDIDKVPTVEELMDEISLI